ncbi:MAG: acyl-CoA dehydratase activase-related protein [Trueperella sp.]|uniref:acyl-CoA dehydratase activase-related protein n=1 Tax=Trueperella sp. TaxID=2699835 RepID=UPI0025E9CA31|nr:acyl-CoA dehydratase activase-related protein [Trueperella sp.]MCI7305381.1 acyl-CoA dehydratase activase-related protein [Trueperella sp.]MDY5403650.1 acyl-CoA dehydratase activase-related protein [Trueperella sp.]
MVQADYGTTTHDATLGIDVGSTTVKAVLRRDDETLFADYRRHHADVRTELARLLDDIAEQFPALRVKAAITGSGGLAVSQILEVPFVQEVIAGTQATRTFYPQADVVIELGGEDAKLTYLHPTPEQRMNGTCAGGTGAFIDQMATLLHTDAPGLDKLASRYERLYPIASRCGVFAKSDLQPLINQGAAHEDLAASIFQSVATQTVAGLANGRPIRGTVLFLGGPLHFLPELRAAYERILSGADEFITPPDAQLYVALGASLLAGREDTPAAPIGRMGDRLREADSLGETTMRMRPLFIDDAERAAFDERHGKDAIEVIPTEQASGDLFLGIDAGSTTIKAAVIDSEDRIVFTHYASNEGDPVAAAIEIVARIHNELPQGARIVRSCSTGYGEGIVQSALGVDEGEVETMAHYRAANHIAPGVSSVIDIGGQDMKYLKIRDGLVDSISVNEACSSGCGSFLQTFAATMNTDIASFAKLATQASAPVDLGTRCTVFMNSSVKQAQKDGANVGDISAGLSYSVVRNALYKVIKLKDPSDLGDKVVVQGGTFLNDAVLRAFELLTHREVIRPRIAGLMGAFGAALTAKSHFDPDLAARHAEAEGRSPERLTSLLTVEELEGLTVETSMKTCRLCQNHCQMTISTFSTGERHVSGNRCERGASLERVPKKSPIPNMYDWKYKRVFGYRRLTEAAATRGDIGIPRVLNMYEDYPFWFTVLSKLHFRVILSGRSNHDLFEKGMESIPSENVCYPAKLAHGHIESLLDKGIKRIFYPCVSYNEKAFEGADDSYNCPIVATYPEALRNNMGRIVQEKAEFISPFLSLADRQLLPKRLAEVFAADGVSEAEARAACEEGWKEMEAFHEDVRAKGEEALAYVRQHKIRAIVLAGRPYHLDPEINHGIPEVIIGLGAAVLTEDALALGNLERPLRVRDQWAFHSRLYEAAETTAEDPAISLVQLVSFGCGLDAITADQVQEILEAKDDIYTSLKIDEVSNLGAAKIRLRSLTAAIGERESRPLEHEEVPTHLAPGRMNNDDARRPTHVTPAVAFTREMKDAGYTILAPQMAPIHFRLFTPVLRRAGYNVKLLERTSKEDIEVGLKYVNNDACYPALVVIGQLLARFIEGSEDPDRTAVMITQTGGMCRATNYAGLLRKGLRDAGYPQVPVIAASLQGLEDNPGFSLTAPMLHRFIQAMTVGDLLQKVVLRTRPYQIEGNVAALYDKWDRVSREFFENGGYCPTLGRKIGFHALLRSIVAEFDSVPLQDIPRKPRVGMVGEILVQYHPDANNDAVGTIEAEGCEAVLPALSQFFQQGFITADWNRATIGKGTNVTRWASKFGLWALEQYEKPMRKLLAASERFEAGATVRELMEKVQEIASLGNQAGEGWYLTADMMDMIENGCPNIICAQPFACLPNHVIGKGMFHPLREKYPQANIVGIDYDPGASEVNQLNRIKLMISTALENHNQGDPILHMDPLAGFTDPVADVASEVSRRLVPVTIGRRPPLGAMR